MSDADDTLIGVFGALGLVLVKLRELAHEVEQLRQDVKQLIAAQQKQDQP